MSPRRPERAPSGRRYEPPAPPATVPYVGTADDVDDESSWGEPVAVRAEVAQWRVGRKVGRTIYAVLSDDVQPLIGVMDTPGLALAAVSAHNAALRVWRGSDA